jgi:hypothetical protein
VAEATFSSQSCSHKVKKVHDRKSRAELGSELKDGMTRETLKEIFPGVRSIAVSQSTMLASKLTMRMVLEHMSLIRIYWHHLKSGLLCIRLFNVSEGICDEHLVVGDVCNIR